jgi:hypothetical protein
MDGDGSPGISAVGNLTIVSADVVATAIQMGAAIGAGASSSGRATVGQLTIQSANVTATACAQGAGISAGKADIGVADVGELTIADATIVAVGAGGPAIGAGSASSGGSADVEFLTIINSRITASGDRALIGVGTYSSTARLSIKEAVRLDAPANTTTAIMATSRLASTSLTVSGMMSRVFGDAPSIEDPVDLSFVYGTASNTRREPIANISAIEIGTCTFPGNDAWVVVLSNTNSSWSKSISFPAGLHGLWLSVETPGYYRAIAYSSTGRFWLVPSRDSLLFNVTDLSAAFWQQADLIPLPTATQSLSPNVSQSPPASVTPSATLTQSQSSNVSQSPAASVTPRASASQLPAVSQSPRASVTQSPRESEAPKTPGSSRTVGIIVGIVIGLVIVAVISILVYLACNKEKFRKETPRCTDGQVALKSDSTYMVEML